MRFARLRRPQAPRGAACRRCTTSPGSTCTEETFAIKAGAQRVAAELGLVLVTCDTSPRAARYPGDDADWDFGQGAGFYVDATQAPWRAAYRMDTLRHARAARASSSSASRSLRDARGIFGHSMGGHGALALALRNPDRYRSVSAFAPIVAPSATSTNVVSQYLGPKQPDLVDAGLRAHTSLVNSTCRWTGKVSREEHLNTTPSQLWKSRCRPTHKPRLRGQLDALLRRPASSLARRGHTHLARWRWGDVRRLVAVAMAITSWRRGKASAVAELGFGSSGNHKSPWSRQLYPCDRRQKQTRPGPLARPSFHEQLGCGCGPAFEPSWTLDPALL